MKTVKIIFPIAAFLFAIVGVFANAATRNLALVDGYERIVSPAACNFIQKCDNTTTTDQCISSEAKGSKPLYIKSGSTCNTALQGTWVN